MGCRTQLCFARNSRSPRQRGAVGVRLAVPKAVRDRNARLACTPIGGQHACHHITIMREQLSCARLGGYAPSSVVNRCWYPRSARAKPQPPLNTSAIGTMSDNHARNQGLLGKQLPCLSRKDSTPRFIARRTRTMRWGGCTALCAFFRAALQTLGHVGTTR